MKKFEDMDARISSMYSARMLIEMALALEPEGTVDLPGSPPIFRLLFGALTCIEHGVFNHELNDKTKELLYQISDAAKREEDAMQTGKLN